MEIRRTYTTVKDGRAFDVVIEFDVEEIAQALAARAIHAKGRKATALRGAIRCRVAREDKPQELPQS